MSEFDVTTSENEHSSPLLPTSRSEETREDLQDETGAKSKTEPGPPTVAEEGTSIAENENGTEQKDSLNLDDNNVTHSTPKEDNKDSTNGLICENVPSPASQGSPSSPTEGPSLVAGESECDDDGDCCDTVNEETCSRTRPYEGKRRDHLEGAKSPLASAEEKAKPTHHVDSEVSTVKLQPICSSDVKQASSSRSSTEPELHLSNKTERSQHQSESDGERRNSTGGGRLDESCSAETETSRSRHRVGISPTLKVQVEDLSFPSKAIPKSPTRDHKDKRLEHSRNSFQASPVLSPTGSSSVNKKGSKIPVGIAVAWQRLVTTNPTLHTNTTVTTSDTLCKPSNMSHPKDNAHSRSSKPHLVRPASVSPVGKAGGGSSKRFDEVGRHVKAHVLTTHGVNEGSNKSPEVTGSGTCRPLPSSSVPPNLGLSSYFHQPPSVLDYRHYGNMGSMTPFPHHSNHHFPLPPTWQTTNPHATGLGNDLSVPHGYSSAYLQPSMQPQFPLHHYAQVSNYSSSHPDFLSPFDPYQRAHFEQLIHQSEYLRHFHLTQQQSQQLLSADLYAMNEGLRTVPTTFPPNTTGQRVSIPLLSPSPTGSVRTPTPNSALHHALSLSNGSTGLSLPATVTSSSGWTADLFHHNSSTALSPKSLTSSSPSPVTVQHSPPTSHDHSGLVNSVAGKGSSHSATTFSTNKVPTPSSKLTTKGSDDERCRIPPKKKYLSMSSALEAKAKDGVEGKEKAEGNQKKEREVESAFSVPSNSKDEGRHDFKRLDSLIERRDVDEKVETEIEMRKDETKRLSSLGESNVQRESEKVETNVDLKASPITETTNLQLKKADTVPEMKDTSGQVERVELSIPVIEGLSRKTVKRKKKEKEKDAFNNLDREKKVKKGSKRKEESSQSSSNENNAKIKQPKVKVATKRVRGVECEQLPVARKPCKIKPDININVNGAPEPLQLKKQSKPKVYKAKKKRKEQEEASLICDSHGESDAERNNVPDMNLPVAASDSALSEIDASIERVARSDDDKYQAVPLPYPVKKSKRNSKKKDSRNESGLGPMKPKAKDLKGKVRKVRDKVEKAGTARKTKKPVTIESRKEVAEIRSPILTTQAQPSIPSATVSVKVPTVGSISSSGERNLIPLSLPYQQGSPVTLILPRLLPTTTMTNAHQKSSFKLVVTSQQIKIPAFVPTQAGINTTAGESIPTQIPTFQIQQEHKFSSTVTSSSTLLVGGAESSNNDNTITFIRDSSPPRQNGVVETLSSGSSPTRQFTPTVTHPPPVSCYLSPPTPTSIPQAIRKERPQHDENHLNLLATVAQEFGAREDLGRLASRSSSSRGSSLMASPTLPLQSPEMSFPTPSSTSSGNTASVASNVSFPGSPQDVKPMKPAHDEYEYDEWDRGTSGDQTPYKHPVWLKIPQVLPLAANKAAEKRKQMEKRKQAKFELEKAKGKGRKVDASKDVKQGLTTQQDGAKQRKKQKENNSHARKKSTSISSTDESKPTLSPKRTRSPKKKEGEPFSMKMTLPVPKVAKLRIKLSETDNPSLIDEHNNNNNNNNSVANGSSENVKKEKPKSKQRMGSGESDKVKVSNKRPRTDKGSVMATNPELKPLKQKKKKKSKNYPESDNKEKNGESKPISVVTAPSDSMKEKPCSGDLFHSSFSSLTPPPTAKLTVEANMEDKYTSPKVSPPSSYEGERKRPEDDECPPSNPNWIENPQFAVSAIRVNNSKNIKSEPASSTQQFEDSSDDDAEHNLREYERQSALFMKPEGTKFLTSPNNNNNTNRQQHHHIKPCLKAEPVLKSNPSSEDEYNSDADIDLEVASLTNSIPETNRKSDKKERTSRSQPVEWKQVGKPAIHGKREGISKRRLSGSPKKTKPELSRRLSLNLEQRARNLEHGEGSEEEELLDVGGYSVPAAVNGLPNKHGGKSSRRSSGESKRNGNGSKQRRSSGPGSTPKKIAKRGSRSHTSSSRSSVSSSMGVSRSRTAEVASSQFDETLIPGKIELESVADLKDEMRILTEIQGLFYTGKLNALQPPDVYGVTLDNERGAPPHLIFSAEEVLEKCVREKKPRTLTVGLRICAYWSPQYSGLYPGRVDPSFEPERDMIPIEFDDGDTGMIKLGEIRLLPSNHPIRAYDPNPLLTLEKKHRKRRHSSTNANSGTCTGDHEEPDCGESFCAKLAKLQEEREEEEEEEEDEEDNGNVYNKPLYWTWTGLGYKRTKSKHGKNKEFFKGIQRGDEVINVGDSAIFISHGNERPYIGRIEKFWEMKGKKEVQVRWFYHPEEVKSPKRIPHLKYSGALFESPHIDENDVQTIARKCDVLPYPEFKERIGRTPKLSMKNSKTKDLYYIAGYYDPYTYNLQMKM